MSADPSTCTCVRSGPHVRSCPLYHESATERYDPATVFLRQEIEALRRIAAELRGFFSPEARKEPEVQAILHDCDTLDGIASRMMFNSIPVGQMVARSIPANSTGGGTAQDVQAMGNAQLTDLLGNPNTPQELADAASDEWVKRNPNGV